MFFSGQQVTVFPCRPFTALITSGGRPNHKYSGFMDFTRWRWGKMSRVRLFGSSAGKQTGSARGPLKGRIIAVSTLFGEMDVCCENMAK